MAVTSRPTAENNQRAKRIDVRTAPIHANDLDLVGAILRWMIGGGMVLYSIATTALLFDRFLSPAIKTGINVGFTVLTWGFLIGIAFGIVVTLIEWATTKRAPAVHWAIILLLDAPFTTTQTALWLFILAAAYEASTPWYAGIVVLSIAWGIFVAWLGEKLLITTED